MRYTVNLYEPEPNKVSKAIAVAVGSKSSAQYQAQQWCQKQMRYADIIATYSGKLVMRYWRDTEGLQFMEY